MAMTEEQIRANIHRLQCDLADLLPPSKYAARKTLATVGSVEIIADEKSCGSLKIDGVEQQGVRRVVLRLEVNHIPSLEVERMPKGKDGKYFMVTGFKNCEQEQDDGTT